MKNITLYLGIGNGGIVVIGRLGFISKSCLNDLAEGVKEMYCHSYSVNPISIFLMKTGKFVGVILASAISSYIEMFKRDYHIYFHYQISYN